MKNFLVGAASAAAAFLFAPLLVRDHTQPKPAVPFPAETVSFREPSAWDPVWRENRGHAFSLKDRDESSPTDDPRWNRILAGRPKQRPIPASCLGCHASIGTAAQPAPLGCPDCHDPRTTVLRLARTAPHAPANYEDLRTMLCAQCHHSTDNHWEHAETRAEVVEIRHPQFEMYSEGIHARAGASCADCHMPAHRSGAAHITSHNARSPRKNLNNACLRCHSASPAEMRARLDEIQHRNTALLSRAQDALVAAIDEIAAAQAAGARVDTALRFQTEAERRITLVAADRSQGFHAPQESARLLGEAIDFARQAQLVSLKEVKER